MSILNLLSAVQIVLESLPVSSSGNVVLLMDFLPYWFSINTLPVVSEQFLFFLHGPTVLVVAAFFFRQWIGYLIKLIKRDSTIFPLVFFGVITNVVTVFFYALNSHFLIFDTFQVPLWIGFLITTLLLFSTKLPWILRSLLRSVSFEGQVAQNDEWKCDMSDILCNSKFPCTCHPEVTKDPGLINKKPNNKWWGKILTFIRLPWIPRCALDDECRTTQDDKVSLDDECEYNAPGSINKNQIKPLRHGLLLGLAQSAALFVPGISRLASTFVVGRWVGWQPLVALEYSFLIEFPLICAGFLKGFLWAVKTPEAHQIFTSSFLITVVLSTILAYAALVFVARCAQNNKIWLFGFYTGLLAVISFVL